MERTASFVWYGPFALMGKRGDSASVRLGEIANFQGATKGLFLLVGSTRRGLIRPDQVIYVGLAERAFPHRLAQLMEPGRGEDAKIHAIEKRGGRVTSIWLGALASMPANPLHDSDGLAGAMDGEEDPGASTELVAHKNLLIHLALRNQNDWPAAASDHLNRTGFAAPPRSMVMINRFNTDSWEHKHRPKWRPTMIPDIIDCTVEEGQSRAQLIWTGTRGCAMQRRECRPGRLTGAARSHPHKGPRPTL